MLGVMAFLCLWSRSALTFLGFGGWTACCGRAARLRLPLGELSWSLQLLSSCAISITQAVSSQLISLLSVNLMDIAYMGTSPDNEILSSYLFLKLQAACGPS